MTLLAPSGLISTPTVALARLLAESTTWQSIVGFGVNGAINFIQYQEIDDTLDAANPDNSPADGQVVQKNAPPRAIIYWPEGWALTRSGPGSWRDAGILDLAIELPIPDENLFKNFHDYRNEYLYFANQLGGIVQDLRDKSGGVSSNGGLPLLNVNRIEFMHAPMPCDPADEYSYFWGCELRVHYL
jgi:hypothetical protein